MYIMYYLLERINNYYSDLQETALFLMQSFKRDHNSNCRPSTPGSVPAGHKRDNRS